MEYQAFVFDFDGVLADSVEIKTQAFAQLYLAHGQDVADEVVRFHRDNGGMPRRQKFEYYQRELLGAPATEEDLNRLSRAFSELVVRNVVAAPEIPGALDFIRKWHGRVPLFIDSATPDAELRLIADQRQLSRYFEDMFGSDRSKKENLAGIIEQKGFAPDKILFFGDALSDYAAARACGTGFVGIVPDAESILVREHPDIAWYRNFTELTLP